MTKNTARQLSFYRNPDEKHVSFFTWPNLEMKASDEWDINSAYLSLCRVGMTRQRNSSIIFP